MKRTVGSVYKLNVDYMRKECLEYKIAAVWATRRCIEASISVSYA